MNYINQQTGEVYEDKRELITKDMNEIVDEDELLDKLYQLEALEEQISIWKFKHKEQIKEVFIKYNIKTFKNDYMTISYVPAHKSRSVDTQKLKDAGLYDEFCKETEVKDSIRIGLNNER